MRRITTGDLARAIRKYNPIVDEHMVRGWVEADLIKTYRNPLTSKRGTWYFLEPNSVAEFIRSGQLDFQPDEITGILERLGMNYVQFKLRVQ